MLVLGFAVFHFLNVLLQVVKSGDVLFDDDVGDFLVGRLLGVGLAQVFIVARNLYLVLCPFVTLLTNLSDFVQDLLRSCHLL